MTTQGKENMLFTEKAVNSHDALVEALKALRKWHGKDEEEAWLTEKIDKALALAEGKG